jgi:hypothetical protein
VHHGGTGNHGGGAFAWRQPDGLIAVAHAGPCVARAEISSVGDVIERVGIGTDTARLTTVEVGDGLHFTAVEAEISACRSMNWRRARIRCGAVIVTGRLGPQTAPVPASIIEV